MSYSGLPALDIDPLKRAADINQTNAQTALTRQNTNLVQQNIAASKQALETTTALAPFVVKDAKRQSGLADAAAANQTLAQVAKDAQAADPADAPDIWDRGMQAAAASGNQVASQYVGHYRPDLAERVGDIYGAPAGGGAGARAASGGAAQMDQDAMERAIASMPAPKVVQALGNLNRAITSFNTVKDKESWDAEMQALKDSGIDPSRFLPSTDWNPMNYAAAARTIKSLVPYRDAMAQRAAISAAGATPPAPKPLGTSSYIGSQPDTQFPVYHNTTTGEDTVGKVAVGPKPSAAISTFQYKLKLAQGSGMGDQDALAFANGTKSLPPERLQAIALSEANKELGDATLAGAVIPDPDAWVRDKARQNFQLLSASTVKAPGGGGAGGGGSTTPAPAALPPRALDAVKAAAGRPVKFNNGLTYKWDQKAQRAVPVQ
jgi:hypothetical protein